MDVKDETQFEYTISNFTACCRICLSTKENEPYYDIYLTSLASYQEITLIEAIQRITNVEVLTNSKLPSKICKLCSARLDDAYCLARDFIRINEMLHNYLDNEVMDRDDGGDINLTTIEELCGLDVPEEEVKGEEQQLEGMIESELPPQQVDDQSEDSKQQQQQPDNQSDCAELQHQQPSGEELSLTAVDFILQQVSAPSGKLKRQRNKPTIKHSCTKCDKSFLRRSNLIDHLRLHAQLKVYACDYCDKRFVQAGNLKTHTRTHTLERPFHCNTCDKAFTQSSALKTHMLTHTNVKPFACDVCDKAFTSSSDLCKHKLTHSSKKQYRCIICPERYFTQKVHLRNHLTRMHPTSNLAVSLEAGIVK